MLFKMKLSFFKKASIPVLTTGNWTLLGVIQKSLKSKQKRNQFISNQNFFSETTPTVQSTLYGANKDKRQFLRLFVTIIHNQCSQHSRIFLYTTNNFILCHFFIFFRTVIGVHWLLGGSRECKLGKNGFAQHATKSCLSQIKLGPGLEQLTAGQPPF